MEQQTVQNAEMRTDDECFLYAVWVTVLAVVGNAECLAGVTTEDLARLEVQWDRQEVDLARFR